LTVAVVILCSVLDVMITHKADAPTVGVAARMDREVVVGVCTAVLPAWS
jgi:hypothetical protein